MRNAPLHRLAWGLVLLLLAAVPASAASRLYRFELSLLSGDSSFAGEIAAGARPVGPRYEVETDAAGRLLRVAFWQDAERLNERRYRYGAGNRPSGYDFYRGGELASRVDWVRDAAGNVTRSTSRDPQGSRTGYTDASVQGRRRSWTNFSGTGNALGEGHADYDAAGLLLRSTVRDRDGSNIETEVDPNTGLATGSRTIDRDGKLELSVRFSRDANGTLLRRDVYDETGTWYGASEYSDGLERRRFYRFRDGSTQETRPSYDANRLARSTDFYINGTLICRFQYDRRPGGSLIRTIAVSPSGELWAEYPEIYVDRVERDGRGIRGAGGRIFRSGNWW